MASRRLDTRRWANESAIPFTLWLAVPAGAAAAATTLLTTDESVLLQVCAGVFGAAAGALVGVFAALVVATASAPIRERDEARTRVRADGHDRLSKLRKTWRPSPSRLARIIRLTAPRQVDVAPGYRALS